ncbi:prevent-host-death protein [Herbaspirillum rubrisubalbicans]|uniref:Prevent-host-death protein n=3 Tax=Herbaspirillum rubrisubalbicans TaxID=80842 RepID=A0ABX9C4F9_9BURK|nr:prevent-host-death protein [Herbaspirillum rubrisubalbicans Os34]RAM65263.1 prevent-host-death protein [Herbaspirillum rubrisubalbicans]RAN48989.1 prevent-host-death protein [Herbaspirillum rubrisubalbicans]
MRTNYVSGAEFSAKVQEYLRKIEASGESVVITADGKPTLKVCPFRNADRQPLDILAGSVLRFDDPTSPIYVHSP